MYCIISNFFDPRPLPWSKLYTSIARSLFILINPTGYRSSWKEMLFQRGVLLLICHLLAGRLVGTLAHSTHSDTIPPEGIIRAQVIILNEEECYLKVNITWDKIPSPRPSDVVALYTHSRHQQGTTHEHTHSVPIRYWFVSELSPNTWYSGYGSIITEIRNIYRTEFLVSYVKGDALSVDLKEGSESNVISKGFGFEQGSCAKASVRLAVGSQPG